MVCQRSVLGFALEQLLSNLCSLLQESVSSLVHRCLDPGLLPQKAASLHPSPLPSVNSLPQQDTGEASLGREGGHVLVSVYGCLCGGDIALRSISIAFIMGIWTEMVVTACRRLLEGWLGLFSQTAWLWALFVPLLRYTLRVLLAGAMAAMAHCLSPMAVTREIFLG